MNGRPFTGRVQQAVNDRVWVFRVNAYDDHGYHPRRPIAGCFDPGKKDAKLARSDVEDGGSTGPPSSNESGRRSRAVRWRLVVLFNEAAFHGIAAIRSYQPLSELNSVPQVVPVDELTILI